MNKVKQIQHSLVNRFSDIQMLLGIMIQIAYASGDVFVKPTVTWGTVRFTLPEDLGQENITLTESLTNFELSREDLNFLSDKIIPRFYHSLKSLGKARMAVTSMSDAGLRDTLKPVISQALKDTTSAVLAIVHNYRNNPQKALDITLALKLQDLVEIVSNLVNTESGGYTDEAELVRSFNRIGQAIRWRFNKAKYLTGLKTFTLVI